MGGWITDVKTTGGDTNTREILQRSDSEPRFHGPSHNGTHMRKKGVASVERNKQMVGTSTEKWAKARAHEARPSTNFREPNNFFTNFENHSHPIQNDNTLQIYQTIKKPCSMQTNQKFIKLLVTHGGIKCMWAPTPLALRDGPPLSSVITFNI
jgi:hypothetical protein